MLAKWHRRTVTSRVRVEIIARLSALLVFEEIKIDTMENSRDLQLATKVSIHSGWVASPAGAVVTSTDWLSPDITQAVRLILLLRSLFLLLLLPLRCIR